MDENNNVPILYLILPCFNEEEILLKTTEETDKKINQLIEQDKISNLSRVLYVDDGSIDNTWNIIEDIHSQNKRFCGLKFSKNKGHQNALFAGLMFAKDKSDITISMDADLQDDLDVIDEMINEYGKGSQIVYGIRSSRQSDSFFKKFTAENFYRFMAFLGVEIVFNHADCRLMSKKSLNALEEYEEVNLFLRGIVPQLGFKTSNVYYERNKRELGQSKYPFKKMVKFAFEGITSFSIRPLKMITSLGFIMAIFSFIVMVYALIVKILGSAVSGWTFIIISIWLVSGIQMLSIGILGEYVGKMYIETKKRPRYIIEKELFD
nr:glycosyltransferase family 2 protein [uncultured Methanobrevibacter sp.]